MSDEVFANITRHCHFDNSDSDGVECNGALNGVDPGHIDGYNIYAPICVDAANGAYYPSGYVRQTIHNVLASLLIKFGSAKIVF